MYRPHTLAFFAWQRSPILCVTAHALLLGCTVTLLFSANVIGVLRTWVGIVGIAAPACYWLGTLLHRALLVRRWQRTLVLDILGRRLGPLHKHWPERAKAGHRAALLIIKRYPWAYHPRAFWYALTTNTLHMRWRSGQTFVDIELGDQVGVTCGDDEDKYLDVFAWNEPLPAAPIRYLQQLTA